MQKKAWWWTQALILTLLVSSCATQRRCFEKFPLKDSVTVEYRDTVYVFKTYADTVYASGELWDTINVSTGMTVGYGWIVRDTLKLKLVQRDTVFTFRDSIRTEVKEVIRTVNVLCRKTPVLNKIIVLAVILFVSSVLLYIKINSLARWGSEFGGVSSTPFFISVSHQL